MGSEHATGLAQGEPDPDAVSSRTDLARELTALRDTARLTVRELARRVDAPAATLGGYFAGRHLPKPSQVDLFRAILSECGVRDAPGIERWEHALDRARFASDGRAAKEASPYRGLEPFGEADAGLFFGRAAAISELLGRLRALRDDPGPSGGVLALVGPSGSGKSSLLGAGLVPAVRGGGLDTAGIAWDCVLTTPAGSVDLLAAASPLRSEQHTVLVVDQFEEVLAAAPGSAARTRFLEALAHPARSPALVVLGMRTDYYDAAATEPVLLAALRHAQMLLGPMTGAEVREAIAKPARTVGAAVEDGLVDLVLADLAPGSPTGFAHDAGALPLLSHALLVTWERAQRNHLTIADYRAAGGLRGAVRQSAEELYQELSVAEQELARRIFTRLVRIESDEPLARRRIQRRELAALHPRSGSQAPGEIDNVLERFVTARLLTADADTVVISHEALLSAWPRLAGWIDADRAGLRVHHQIADAARAWEAAHGDESLLWRGTPLETATEWAADPGHDAELNQTERAFLHSAVTHRDAQQRAAHRRTRRMQQLVAALAAMAVVASLLAAYAFHARASANQARDQALSRQVAIEAQQLRASDPALAAQLALAAYRIAPTVQARSALIEASGGEMPARLLGPVGPAFVASGDGGRLLAVAQSATDTVQLYSLVDGRAERRARLAVGPSSAQDFAVALSPVGALLAAGDTAGHVVVWNVTDPLHPAKLATLGGFTSTVYSVAFSPAGDQLAAADNNGTVGQWDLSDPARPVPEPTVHVPGAPAMKAVAYSPNGHLMAAGGAGGTLVTWTPGQANATSVAGAGTTTLESVVFSPDGTTLAAGGDDNQFHLWTVTGDGQVQLAHAPISPGPAFVTCLAFSPDGKTLAACSGSSVSLYDTRTWAQVAAFPLPNLATAAVFSPKGTTLTTADSGGVTRRWHLPTPASYRVPGNVFFVQYLRHATVFDVVTAGPTGDVTFWDDRHPLNPIELAAVTMPPSFGPVAGAGAVSPSGRLLAVANARAQIQLIDVTNLRHPHLIGAPLRGNRPYIEQIAFTPNGNVLAAGDNSGQIRLWNVANPAHPRALPTLRGTKGEILGLAFSSNGHLLAAASTDTKVRLYDIANPSHPRPLATVGGFASYAYDAAFTAAGRVLVAGSADGTLRLWNISDPSRPRLLARIVSRLTGDIYQIAVSPDGHTLAATTTDHLLGLWDIANPAQPHLLASLDTGSGALFAVTFDLRSHTLVASGDDQTLHLWDYRASGAARLVCADTGHPITRAEWTVYVQGAPYDPPCSP